MKAPVSIPFLAIGVVRAIALTLIAFGLTQGITGAIAHGDVAGRAMLLAGVGVVLRAGTDWLSSLVSERSATREKTRLRAQLIAQVTATGGAAMRVPQGELMWLATRGLDGLDAWYRQYLPAVSQAMVIPLIIGVIVAVNDWVSGMIVLVTLPLVPLFMWLIGTYTQDRVQHSTDAVARLSSQLVELARGLPVLVGLHRAEEQARALRTITDNVRARTMQTLRVAFLSALALELIATLSVAVVAVFIGVRLVKGSMALEDGLFVLLLAPECYTPLRQIGAAFHASEEGTEAANRVREIIGTDDSEPAAHGDHVELTDVTVHYADRAEPAVEHVSFRVRSGEVVALSGPSGSGKSTLLAAIAGVHPAGDPPRITGEITRVDPAHMAYVAQQPVLVTGTPREEIALALEGEGDPLPLLARVDAAYLADRNVAELSLGELRRVAVARALARVQRGATVVLLDEPVAHLDAGSADLVRQIIGHLPTTCAVILVAHDAATRSVADRVVELPGAATEEEPESSAGAMAASHRSQDDPRQPVPASVSQVLGLLHIHQRGYLLGVIAATAAVASAVCLTALSGWLIVRASEQPPIMYLLVAIVGVRFFGIGRAVFRYSERLAMHGSILESMSLLRQRVWRALAHAGPRNARWLRPGAAMEAMVDTVDTVRDLAPRVFVPPLVGAVVTVLAVIILGAIDPRAGLTLLVGAGAAILLGPWLTVRLDAAAAAREGALRRRLVNQVSSTITAAPDIQGNGLGPVVRGRLSDIDARLTGLANRGAISSGAGTALITLLAAGTSVAMLAVMEDATITRGLAPALLAVVVLAPLALAEPLADLVPAARLWPDLSRSAGVVQQLLAGDDQPPSPRPATSIGAVELRDLSATWPGASSPVFERLSHSARPGDWVVLTGPNGAGKSTVFNVIMGFLPPSAGSVVDGDGRPLGRHARVAWVPQEAHIFDSTVRGNLLLARPREQAPTEAEMLAALTVAGLDDLVKSHPLGLDARVGSAGQQFSGGERTRLAIARALLADADVVLLDEPTAHLDRAGARELLARLRVELADRIVFVITHHPEDSHPGDVHIRLG